MNHRTLLASLITLTLVAGCKKDAKKEEPAPTPTTTDPAKPATDPAKPATDPAKPATDPAKPAGFTGLGSCSFASDRGMCMQFESTWPGTAADEQKGCVEEGGTWTVAACPDAKALGTCTNPVAPGSRLTLYSSKFASADEAKAALCSDQGDVFTPTP